MKRINAAACRINARGGNKVFAAFIFGEDDRFSVVSRNHSSVNREDFVAMVLRASADLSQLESTASRPFIRSLSALL
jgi:hypothetical protein